MSDANQAWLAERLSAAIRNLESIRLYNCPADFDDSMSLTWSRGSATGGYKELAKAMSAIVSSRWSELRGAAIAAAEQEVEKAREELRSSLNGSEK